MQDYIVSAVIILAAVGAVWWACAKGYRAKVYKVAYDLVCKAEAEIVGTKRGQERKAQVVAAIHAFLPAWARVFVTEKTIDDLIETAVAKMKEYLADKAEEA